MNIYEKLLAIQTELKAPKTQYNSFGKYNYRNCEDILEAVKPICKKYNAVLFLTDDIIHIEGRHYVRATATLVDCDKTDDRISVTANAREELEKKGCDSSQVTGASSSYARKYALNGLFDIDDTKDSDTTNQGQESQNIKRQEQNQQKTIKQYSFDEEPKALDVIVKSGRYANMKLRDCPMDFLEWASRSFSGQWKENVDIVIQWKKAHDEKKELEVYDIDDSEEIPFD